MYKIYTTKAIILRSFSFAEADKSYEILTRDFGVLVVDGRGVRKIDSKLRYRLSDFNDCEISLVKGRERWRVASVESNFNFFSILRFNPEALDVFKRITSLIRRLVPEAERNEIFFDIVRNGFLFLSEQDLKGKDINNFECIFVLKILHCLGYLGTSPDFIFFVDSPVFNNSLIFEMNKMREDAVIAINKSIKESHL